MLQPRHILGTTVSTLNPCSTRKIERYISFKPLLSKSEGEMPRIDPRVSSGRATQTLRVNWRPPPKRSRGPSTSLRGPDHVLHPPGRGQAGGGVSMDPGERVVVATFPPSLGCLFESKFDRYSFHPNSIHQSIVEIIVYS